MVGFQAIQHYFQLSKPPLAVNKLHLPAVLELPAAACTVQDVWSPSDVDSEP